MRMWRKRKPSSPGNSGFSGPDQLLTNERSQARRHLGLLGGERLNGTSVEYLTLDRASLDHAPLGRRELVDTRREQRLQRGRHDHLAVRFAGHGEHLLDEEGVAPRGASDRVAQLADDALRDQLVDVSVAQGFEPKRHRPCRAALRELRPRDAEQQDRCPRGQELDVLDQVEDPPPRPTGCRRRRPRAAVPPRRAPASCETPTLSPPRMSPRPLSPSNEPTASAAAPSGGCTKLLQHLDDRPIGDPLAVRGAAAAQDRRLDRRKHPPRRAETCRRPHPPRP